MLNYVKSNWLGLTVSAVGGLAIGLLDKARTEKQIEALREERESVFGKDWASHLDK